MPRFFCPQELAVGAHLTLPDAVAHHVQVLRLPPGTHLTLFDGSGGEYIATISVLEKRRVCVEVKTFSPREAELPFSLTLAQALPESSKMDWIVEKAVELGVACVAPLAARRCVTRLSGERAEKRRAHWQAIVRAASEQCGRNRLAQVAEPAEFSAWIGRHDLHRRILLTPRATMALPDWARHHPPQAITLLAGPEGGFCEEEENLAIAHGALPLSMGPRILRTETAGLAALATIAALWGGMEAESA